MGIPADAPNPETAATPSSKFILRPEIVARHNKLNVFYPNGGPRLAGSMSIPQSPRRIDLSAGKEVRANLFPSPGVMTRGTEPFDGPGSWTRGCATGRKH